MRKLTTLLQCLLVFLLTVSCTAGPTDAVFFESHLYTSIETSSSIVEHCKALFLIRVDITVLSKEGNGKENTYYGSGFLYSDGLTVITAKHVLNPELFDERSAEKIGLGGKVSSKKIYMWRTDTTFKKEGDVDLSTALQQKKDFRVGKAARGTYTDNFTYIISKDGLKTEQIPWLLHDLGPSDIATLKLEKKITDIKGLEVRSVGDHEKGSTCYMLGFPGGPDGIAINTLNPTVSTSFVRKVELVLETSGVVIAGNSGGPMIDADGLVIGLVSYRSTRVTCYSVKGDDILAVLK